MRLFKCILLIVSFAFNAGAQTKFAVIYLKSKDKGTHSISLPQQFLSAKALARRDRYAIALDSLDLPVSAFYIDSLKREGLTVHHVSKWLNAVLVEGDSNAIRRLLDKRFIKSPPVFVTKRFTKQVAHTCSDASLLDAPLKPSRACGLNPLQVQYDMHGITQMHLDGFKGDGITIAVLDAGFSNANRHPAFRHLFNTGRVAGFEDFYTKGNDVFTNISAHGSQCLTSLAAHDTLNNLVGLAPQATYYLFRTEVATRELADECFYWVAACERADSLGVDVISSSLGYAQFDRAFEGFDTSGLGVNTTFITRAANVASTRGLFVVNAAGNEGTNRSWGGHITYPADAEMALCVGAVSRDSLHAPFSGKGIATSGTRIKPDVVSLGVSCAIVSGSGGYTTGNGTSYATPTVAGLVAGLVQAYPNVSPQKLFEIMRVSSSQASMPDQYTGYGIPSYTRVKKWMTDHSSMVMATIVFPNPVGQNQRVTLLNGTGLNARLYSIQGALLATYTSDAIYAPATPGIYLLLDSAGVVNKLVVQ